MLEGTDNDRYRERGTKADAGKAPLDLIPWESVEGAARVFGFGAKKYAPRNWQGLSKSRLYAATFRHMIAWWGGEDLDAETGESHLYHAACCILMLASHHGIDDRPHTLDQEAEYEQARASRVLAAKELAVLATSDDFPPTSLYEGDGLTTYPAAPEDFHP